MQARFSQLQVTFECEWMICWQGPVCPLQQTYIIRVFYVCVDILGGCDVLNYGPDIDVVEPILRRRSADDPIPHIYPARSHPDQPRLCLYDPAEAEWKSSDAIADTIIPWAIDWLACYEGWFATGEWHGGGRHLTPRRVGRSCPASLHRPDDRQDRSVSAGFHSLGRKTGSFASLPLMVAASEGSSPRLSSQDWRNATSVALRLRDILTSSPEPLPAESSLWVLPPDSPQPS